MRKVLSFVLVLALVLGSFSMVFGASYSDMAGEKSSEAVDVLSGLGVISGYPDGTFKPDNIVTRAEMAKLIVAALGLEAYATATTSKYPDMTAAPWAQGFVAYGTSLGFISGYPDGTFKPNQTVSYEEACSMILRALGYTSEFLPGEWPAEWVVKAKSLGILDGISASLSGGANRGDIADMLYNALELSIGYVDKDGVWQLYENDSMLVRLGAKFIAADDAKALTGAGFEADGVIYGDEESMINLRAYVGAYSDRYVNEDDEIIKVVPVSVFLTGEYDGDVFAADNDVDYNFPTSYDKDIPYFENGESDTTVDPGDFIGDDFEDYTVTIAVKISGKSIKEFYSVATWDVSDSFMFEDTDADAIADDQELGLFEFILDDNDDIDFDSFELLGVDSLNDIDEDNVVYVYANGDYIRKVEVGTEVVSGEITKISSNRAKVTVNGKVYEFSAEFTPPTFDLEDEYDFYLDYAGDIYFMDAITTSAANYGILLAVDDATDGLRGEDALAKVFLADGSTKTFSVDSDITTDLVSDGAWGVSSPEGIWIKYSVDAEGVIDAIVWIEDEEEDFAWDWDYAYDYEVSTRGYFYGYPIAADAVIFTADVAASSEKDDYGTTTLANIKGKTLDYAEFIYQDGKIIAMYIVGSGVSSADDVYGVVTDKYESTASDTGYMATVLVDGVAKDYEVVGSTFYTALEKSKVLYELDLNAKGQLVDLLDVEYEEYGTIEVKYANGVINVGNPYDYAIDPDAVVYKWSSTSGKFTVSTLSATVLKVGETVYLYDLGDDDYVITVILVNSPTVPM